MHPSHPLQEALRSPNLQPEIVTFKIFHFLKNAILPISHCHFHIFFSTPYIIRYISCILVYITRELQVFLRSPNKPNTNTMYFKIQQNLIENNMLSLSNSFSQLIGLPLCLTLTFRIQGVLSDFLSCLCHRNKLQIKRVTINEILLKFEG